MERCHRCGSEITSGGCPSPTCQTTWHSVGMHLGAHIDPDPRDAEIAALKAAQEGIHAVGYREGVLAERQHSLKATADGNAEIAALKAEVARRDRALAAGPAALWAMKPPTHWAAVRVVEAAQEAAMKEGGVMGTWSDNEKAREHDREVAFNLGRAQGRADERAAIVAWLRALPTPLERIEYLAQAFERGDHEEKVKP